MLPGKTPQLYIIKRKQVYIVFSLRHETYVQR